MTSADPILSMLTDRPMSSFQLCEELWRKHRIGKCATSKRLERLFKKGKIGRYLRIERGAYVYCILGLHSEELLQETSRNIVSKSSGALARVLQTAHTGRILSIFELGRITNIRSFSKEGQRSHKVADLVGKLEKLGLQSRESYLLHPSVPWSDIYRLVSDYETSMNDEAYLLAYAKRLFIDKKMAEEMTLYREPSEESLARHKFDIFGHGGRRNRIRIVVECNLRREVTPADLEGFSQRIGGTIKRSSMRSKLVDRSPIARYYIARRFSEEAKAFATRQDKGIRLLDADAVLRGFLEEIQSYRIVSKRKLLFYGRFKEVRGIAFEAQIEPVFQQRGFKTKRRKPFFLDGNNVGDKDTGKTLTDVDLFAERKNGSHEMLLIECKSGLENSSRSKLIEKTRKYQRIANFLQAENPSCQIRIIIIAKVKEADREELIDKAKFTMEFITPVEFYNANPRALKGAPKWIFGL